MKKETITQVLQLQSVALQLDAPDYAVFTQYSAHVHWLEIGVYKGGWKRGMHPDNNYFFYTDGRSTDEDMYLLIERLTNEKKDWSAATGARFAEEYEQEQYPEFLLNLYDFESESNTPAFLRRQAD